MSNSDFENNVRHELDDLSIEPSDALWDRVEAELPEKRNRRWALLFLPLLLAGAIFFIVNYDNIPRDPQQLGETKPEINPNTTIESSSNIDKNGTSTINASRKTTTNLRSLPTNRSIISNDGADHKTDERSNKNISRISVKSNEQVIVNAKHNVSKNDKVVLTDAGRFAANIRNAQPESDAESDAVSNQKSAGTKKEPVSNSSINIDTSTNARLSDSKPDIFESTRDADTLSISVASTPKTNELVSTKYPDTTIKGLSKKKIKISEGKWTLGLIAGAGISNVKSGLFSNNEMYLDAYSSAPPTVPSSPASVQARPEAPSLSFAFSTGIYLEKNISSKLVFHTGMNYTYLSSRIETGARVDSGGNFTTNSGTAFVNSYYRNGSINNYLNKFHFISLPLMLQFKPLNKWPLFGEGGITTSVLIRSNALQYDAGRNAYYKNAQAYNRLVFGMQAGIGVQLKSIKFGYRFNHSLNSVMKDASQYPISSMIYFQLPVKKF